MISESSRPVYVISVFAEIVGVHPQTIRHYERSGLLRPARTPGGSRRFSHDDLHLVNRILELTSEGINLAGVRRILDLEAALERSKTPSPPGVSLSLVCAPRRLPVRFER